MIWRSEAPVRTLLRFRFTYLRRTDPKSIEPAPTRNNDPGSGTDVADVKLTLSMAKFQKLAFAEVIETVLMPAPERATVLAALFRLPGSASVKVVLSPRSSDTV